MVIDLHGGDVVFTGIGIAEFMGQYTIKIAETKYGRAVRVSRL